ncbi:unnamed protein product [Aphanomyces euteiches]
MSGFANTVENTMTAVERLGDFDALEKEDKAQSTVEPPSEWPQNGTIEFKNYSMRYRDHLELAVKNVNLTVSSGHQVGICGRTGSGKSSLVAALFRMAPSASGCITIDGIDIASMAVTTLRSRLTIIPQDPMLFSGSLRFNLDPSHLCSDDELWAALKQVHLANFVGSLEFEVSEAGGNLSIGQRQLRKSKVVVLDEATANIDLETDRLIQTMLKESFHDVTRFIIAHRLNTIIDSDRILVLDGGYVKEYDTPATLLENNDGMFAQLVRQAHVQCSL